MADNFSANHVQGQLGEFKPVLDASVSFSANNVQGVWGEFVPVLDAAAGGVPPVLPTISVESGTDVVRVPDKMVGY